MKWSRRLIRIATDGVLRLSLSLWVCVPITKTDLYLAGLSGGADSAARRRALQQELGLPEHLGSAGLLQALNLLMTREEFQHRYGELR